MTTHFEATNKPLRKATARWLALVVLFIAMANPPQALAVPCPSAPALNLAANRWRMVGIPCVPAGILTPFTATVGNIFVGTSNLTAANYANGTTGTWVAWKRTYSASGDSYTQLSVNSPVAVGDALWIYTTAAGTMQVNGTATPGATGTPFTTAPLPGIPAGRYIMYANPWPNTLSWLNVTFAGSVNGVPFSNTPLSIAISQGVVSKDVSYWIFNTYLTRDNVPIPPFLPAAQFTPYQSAWIQALPKSPTTDLLTMTAPKP